MSLDAKRCAELIELLQYSQRIPDSITPVSLYAIEQLRDALELLGDCRKALLTYGTGTPEYNRVLDKLTEAGIE